MKSAEQIVYEEALLTAVEAFPEARERVLANIRDNNIHRAKTVVLKALAARVKSRTDEVERIEAELALLKTKQSCIGELMEWVDGPFILERAAGSLWQECSTAIQSATVIDVNVSHKFEREPTDSAIISYVVEHDWGGVLAQANEFSTGEYRLPHNYCCFELQISGKRICVVVSATDGHPHILTPFVKTAYGWAILAPYGRHDNKWATPIIDREDAAFPLVSTIGDQVRAVCIGLEAEVVSAEIIRAPYKLNAAREKIGMLPIYDYHVLSLARRGGPHKFPSGSERGHVRLHFRRGHWRHFPNHKTWIKWMLVGNPDLGFVDKHYRL